MNKLSQKSNSRRMVVAASAILAIMTMAGPARADHVEQGLGVLLGGVVGGALGSAVGKGSGRHVAIGVGSALGALYGNEVARHHGRIRYVHPKYSHTPAVTNYYSPPAAPVYVQPAPVYITPPPRATGTSLNISLGSPSRIVASRTLTTLTECRLLEDGLDPVYGCRDTHGDWRILR